MSTNFPGALDSLTNPTPTSDTAAVSHSSQHADANDAIEALEAKVGANSSGVTTSHDYKLSLVTGSDKALPRDAVATITNKTLGTGTKVTIGSDATGDTYYREADGTLTRAPVGSTGQVMTSNGSNPVWSAPAEVNRYAVSTGSANAYIVTLTPALGSYTAGTLVQFKANFTNTGACTVNVNGLGAIAIKKLNNLDLVSGDIATDMIVELQYDGSVFEMLCPVAKTFPVKIYDGVIDTGSSTAYVMTLVPAITAYSTYQEFTFRATNANTTNTPTLNVNGLGAVTIVNSDGSSVYPGQISANSIVKVVYDGTNMRLISFSNTLGSSTSIFESIASGSVRLNYSDSNSATISSAMSTYTKVKEIVFKDVPGTIRCTWTVSLVSGGTGSPNTKIYVNGVAVGTEKTTSGLLTETSITVTSGDLIQVYANMSGGGTSTYNVNTFRIGYDKQLKLTYQTNTVNL